MARTVGIWSVVFLGLIMLFTVGCAKKAVQVSGPAPAGATGPSAEELRAREEAERRRRIAESQLPARPTVTPGSSVMQPVYFDFDKTTLSTDAQSTLARNAEWLRANPQVRVQVEGNADERGTEEYNLALGERRAESVKGYLTSLGIESNRLNTLSYGEERPADPGHSESAWSKNRRAEFKAM
jgi:peptidoglycan-associated lipoprotein